MEFFRTKSSETCRESAELLTKNQLQKAKSWSKSFFSRNKRNHEPQTSAENSDEGSDYLSDSNMGSKLNSNMSGSKTLAGILRNSEREMVADTEPRQECERNQTRMDEYYPGQTERVGVESFGHTRLPHSVDDSRLLESFEAERLRERPFTQVPGAVVNFDEEVRTIPREDSLSTIESPILERPEGNGTVEMETCSEEPRVNVCNQGADDMDVLDTAVQTPEPPRNTGDRPVATLQSLNTQVQEMIDYLGAYTKWSQNEFRVVRADEALCQAKLLTEVENLRRDMQDVQIRQDGYDVDLREVKTEIGNLSRQTLENEASSRERHDATMKLLQDIGAQNQLIASRMSADQSRRPSVEPQGIPDMTSKAS